MSIPSSNTGVGISSSGKQGGDARGIAASFSGAGGGLGLGGGSGSGDDGVGVGVGVGVGTGGQSGSRAGLSGGSATDNTSIGSINIKS